MGGIAALLLHLPDGHWMQLAGVAGAAGAGLLAGLSPRLLAPARSGSLTQEARKQWARRLADASFDGLLIHRNGSILQMNRALVRMLGYREMELVGTHFSNLAHPSQVADLRTELEAPQPQIAEFTLLHADKTERVVEMASHTLEFDGLPATVSAIRNLTALRAAEARLAHLVHNDALTSLPNRAQFTEKLEDAVAQNDRSGGTTAVTMLQVIALKELNEQLGRNGGDMLLRQIGIRLISIRHENDTVARISGDKFGIVQPHTGAPNRAVSFANQVHNALEEPFIVEGRAVRLNLSIGVAVYPEHAADAEGLVKSSGFALSIANEHGGGTHMFSHAEANSAGFSSSGTGAKGAAQGGLKSLTTEQRKLAQDLRQSIARGEITLDYQPVFATKFLSIAGFEALARWRHPIDGPIPPARFIPMADEVGLASSLGSYIMELACTEAMRSKSPMMAINLSPMQFHDPQFLRRLRDVLQKTGLPPSRLEVQVTETMLAENPVAASTTLQGMRDIGVVITLDDFGTGFASLSNLSEFPFSRIKIDKRFIQALDQDSNAQAIVLAILALADNLHIEVIAEGIETEKQLTFLLEKGCNLVQGYHLGRPGPLPSALALVTPAGTMGKPSLVATQR